MTDPRVIVITGASAGLGAALARLYARPGITLGLVARDASRLAAVADQCRAQGADVSVGALDLTDASSFAGWFQHFDAGAPVDLLIANAGAFTGHGAQDMETVDEMRALVEINTLAAMSTVNAALPAFRRRKRGRIAIVSSLAALQPLADAPAYSASKAAVASYGEALREYLMPDEVGVSVVYPGHIETQQTAVHVGDLPLLMTADDAARRIRRGLDRGRAVIAFPWPLLWLIRLGRLVPWQVRALFGRSLRFHVRKSP